MIRFNLNVNKPKNVSKEALINSIFKKIVASRNNVNKEAQVAEEPVAEEPVPLTVPVPDRRGTSLPPHRALRRSSRRLS